MRDRWPRDLPQGVIHADLFPDNVFFLGNQLSGLIDFYFACTDTLRLRRRDLPQRVVLRVRSFLQRDQGPRIATGYAQGAAAARAERAALPLLARGAALRFLLTRLVDWLNVPPGAMVRPKDPLEYWRRLRFHQAINSARDYGLEAIRNGAEHPIAR